MGGASFKCPLCDTWKLTKSSLKDHLRDKHEVTKVQIEETGSLTYLVTEATRGPKAPKRT